MFCSLLLCSIAYSGETHHTWCSMHTNTQTPDAASARSSRSRCVSWSSVPCPAPESQQRTKPPAFAPLNRALRSQPARPRPSLIENNKRSHSAEKVPRWPRTLPVLRWKSAWKASRSSSAWQDWLGWARFLDFGMAPRGTERDLGKHS